LIAVPAGRTGSLTVPLSVEEIGFGAFEESKLSQILFQEDANILTFGYRAFFKANGITTITVPKSVVSIDYYAFAYCENLPRMTLHKGITEIPYSLFYHCSNLESVDFSKDITSIGGMTKLVKEYGPLHILYTVYLLSYVLIMVGIIWYATKKQRLSSFKYTMLLFVAVLLNIGVWAVEQCFNENFEFLCVSYVVTEVILLLIYGILRDYGIVQPDGQVISVQMLTQMNSRQITPGALPPGIEDLFQGFAEKVKTLSSAERRILNYYIEGHDTADIPDLAFISIHTVKKHNRSIYQKLGVASRDELMLYIELFRCCGRLEELTGQEAVTE
jgi:DNA-binding CsgD family transcriptional regulator